MKRACSMSKEEAVLESSVLLKPGAAEQRDTAGAMLRDGRASLNLDIATLAAMLKVSVHKLQALEQDQSELLGDPVFARALASSMCRILRLDPAPVLHRLPAISAFNMTSQNRGINTPFRTRNDRNDAPLWSHISRPAILVGLALLLGALILVFLPSIQHAIGNFRQDELSKSDQGRVVESASVETMVTNPANPLFSAPTGPAAVASPASGGMNPGDVSMAGPGTATQPTTAPAAGMETLSAEPTVTFNARSRSTSNIKVTNANGLVVFDRVLRAGESASLSGKAPLAVVITRANAVQVQVRGQDFDFASATQNNIARFEVK